VSARRRSRTHYLRRILVHGTEHDGKVATM
jgi:hypothetical protein